MPYIINGDENFRYSRILLKSTLLILILKKSQKNKKSKRFEITKIIKTSFKSLSLFKKSNVLEIIKKDLKIFIFL